MRIYIAGPMRGIEEFNFPAFHAAAARLRAAGHVVFDPAEHDESTGFDATGLTGHEDLAGLGFDLRAALGADLAWITSTAEAVCVLGGWARSKGASAEVCVAVALGLPVLSLEEAAS